MLAGIPDSDHSLVWAEVRRRAIAFKREAGGDPPAPEGGDVPPINFEGLPAWAIMNSRAVPVQPMALAEPEGAFLEHLIDREISDYRFRVQQLPIVKAWDPVSQKVLEYENPLVWWKERQSVYPTLAQMARRILCIPATSAPSERLFSSAGLTISADRTRMLPEHAESVLFIRENWEAVLAWQNNAV